MIDLPLSPAPRSVVPGLQYFGATLTPSTGGPAQRINRLGTRYRITVTMPPLRNEKEGRIWVNRLVRGMQEGVRMEYPLIDFDPGAPQQAIDTPITVDGGGQAGTSLAIAGLQPGYALKEGQPLSIEVAGRHYIDFIAAGTTADGTGNATIMLSQMLRASPTNGDVVHIAKPMIEGFIEGNELNWAIALERFIGLEFAIAESA